MKIFWVNLKRLLKSKFVIYTVIAPTFGALWFFILLPVFEPMLRYSLPRTVTIYLVWGVLKSLFTLVILSPVLGLLAFPVAFLTYLLSSFIHRKMRNQISKGIIIILFGGLISALYANILLPLTWDISLDKLLIINRLTIQFMFVGAITTALAEYLTRKTIKNQTSKP